MESEIDYCRFMSATIDGSGDEADEVAPIIRPKDYISGQNEVFDLNDIWRTDDVCRGHTREERCITPGKARATTLWWTQQ